MNTDTSAIMDAKDLGTVRFATEKDLLYVVSLSKQENFALGFIPKMAYESAITGIKKGDRWSETCNDRLFVIECNDDLVGFCLVSFGRVGSIMKMGKVAQICLQLDARLMQRGRVLLDAVIEYGKTIGTMRWSCGCADDLPSNLFWKTMGWVKIADRFGISHQNTWKQTSKRKVNIYRHDPFDMFVQYEKEKANE
jgi:GNAT superfamily N-acetyltransferase